MYSYSYRESEAADTESTVIVTESQTADTECTVIVTESQTAADTAGRNALVGQCTEHACGRLPTVRYYN